METLVHKIVRLSNVPDRLLLDRNLEELIIQYFSKEENGGGEVLSCACDPVMSSVFVTLKLSIQGLMKVMTATHSIQGANVTVSEVVASESCHFLLTQKPTDPEILGIQTELQRMGVHAVESSASFDQLMKQQAQKNTTSQESEGEWRRQNIPTDKEVMIICSCGDEIGLSIEYTPKQIDNVSRDHLANISMEECSLPLCFRQELDAVLDKMKGTKSMTLTRVCIDSPGMQFSREYYLEKIKQFMEDCTKSGALIWYTGHAEKATGNWVFKDGVISFQDIFALYLDHFRSKSLTLICDCSYSGQWVRKCAALLDDIGIPSCGHHTKESGLLLKVFCACNEDQRANLHLFIQDAVSVDNDREHCWFYLSKQLIAGQSTCGVSFVDIRCSKKLYEECEVQDPGFTWKDRLFTGSLVFLVRGTDRGRNAWHYVLVEKEKESDFSAKVKTGTIDVAKFGKVLHSGWGKDPPDSMRRKIKMRFGTFVYPDD